MEVALVPVLLGLIPANIASKKGYSFAAWWLFGALLFIVALPCALLVQPTIRAMELERVRLGERRCPYCAELIKREAVACRHCGRDVEAATETPVIGEAGRIVELALDLSRQKVDLGSAAAQVRAAAGNDAMLLREAERECSWRVNRSAYMPGGARAWRLLRRAITAVEVGR